MGRYFWRSASGRGDVPLFSYSAPDDIFTPAGVNAGLAERVTPYGRVVPKPTPSPWQRLVIFTEHRDTLNYLQNRITTLLGRKEAVVVIHGGLGREERRKAQEAFLHDPEVRILIATDAAGEGINLQRAHLMVNYDLPWNPNRIEQRFGRIHRIGQTEVCHLWNLVALETREGDVYYTPTFVKAARRARPGARKRAVALAIFGRADRGRAPTRQVGAGDIRRRGRHRAPQVPERGTRRAPRRVREAACGRERGGGPRRDRGAPPLVAFVALLGRPARTATPVRHRSSSTSKSSAGRGSSSPT